LGGEGHGPAREKSAKLAEFARQIEDLRQSMLYDYREENGYQPVLGEGDPAADILFVGEAPGREEAKTGRAFVGRAGKVLDELLKSIGLNRGDVYVTNVVKDRPPDNRVPRVGEIEVYAPLLMRQLEIIEPAVIATLGRLAMDFFLRQFGLRHQGCSIGELHGQTLETEASYGPVTLVPLYHPAAGFYNPDLKEVMKEDFRVLERLIGAGADDGDCLRGAGGCTNDARRSDDGHRDADK